MQLGKVNHVENVVDVEINDDVKVSEAVTVAVANSEQVTASARESVNA